MVMPPDFVPRHSPPEDLDSNERPLAGLVPTSRKERLKATAGLAGSRAD